MYTIEELIQYPYFGKLLSVHALTDILDSLTGLIARPYMLDFIHSLVDSGTPFTLAMMDLDNFKLINDNYGHKAGDGVLAAVSADLRKYMRGIGVAGRFGGDEFLIVYLGGNEYDKIHSFYEGMYQRAEVLRKVIKLEECSPFMTGTIGSASFPENAQDYDTLFEMVDKTLYRGKSKGRNCYIIYVEAKHKNLEMKKLAAHSIYSTVRVVDKIFEEGGTLTEKLKRVFGPLCEDLNISNLYLITQEEQLYSVADQGVLATVQGLDEIVKTDMYEAQSIDELKTVSKELYDVMNERKIESVIIVPVLWHGKNLGYLMCGEANILRIWQDDEHTILYFLSKLVAEHIKEHPEEKL